jgi:hypothetical protein
LAARADQNERGEKVEELVEELFLGEVVYPQDAGEIQFSIGHFWHDGRSDRSTLPVLLEYGITDRLQVGVMLPTSFYESSDPEAHDGLANVEFEVYWSFLNDRETGWAAGIGFGYSLPEAVTGAGEDAHGYEPFVVLYREFGCDALNFSAAVEIEDPRDSDEARETSGDLAAAYIRPLANLPLTALLELATEIEAHETQVQLAPGAYYRPPTAIWEIGCSLPIGLAGEVPDLGVFVMLTFEFE